MVGQEELGKSLFEHIDKFEELKEKYDVQFFFHAGETNWYGHTFDNNLYDAVLLNSKRIGHGYVTYCLITKH